MPNLDAHAHLALSHNPEGGIEFAAGEVFDDIVRMAGGLPKQDAPDSLFSRGIRSNNAVTDKAFDRQPALMDTLEAMSDDMEAAGIPRPLRRTCASIGSDILFSGVTLQRPESVTAYLEACDFMQSTEGSKLIDLSTTTSKRTGIAASEIAQNIRAILAGGLRTDYTDAAFVVDRLRKRVAERPLLAFPDDFDNSTLVDIFAAQHQRLARAANDIYSGTIADIRQDPLHEVRQQHDIPNFPIVPGVLSLVERTGLPVTIDRISGWESIIARELSFYSGNTEEGRQRFIASRAAVQFLLQQAAGTSDGHSISRRDQAMPTFPEGWVGSITHSDGFAAAAIAHEGDFKNIGIDLEVKPRQITRARALTPHELQLPELANTSTRCVLSMKEAIFKAVHPLIANEHPRAFWFQDAEITTLDIPRSKAEIRLTGTDRGKTVAAILGDVSITCYGMETDWFSSAVCVVT